MTGEIWVLRHGQTPWAANGKYTGFTDVKLDDVGVAQAMDARKRLVDLHPDKFELVLSSPLNRAHDTALLAVPGQQVEIDDRLREWDYGVAEGRTRDEIHEIMRSRGFDKPWDVWIDGPQALPEWMAYSTEEPVGPGKTIHVDRTYGETIEHLRHRVQSVLDTVADIVNNDGDVLLVAHSHVLRELTAAWLSMPTTAGRKFELGTARIGVLGDHKGDHVIRGWGL